MAFPIDLLGAVWHTTSIVRFGGIHRSGCILAEPDIPAEERWKTSAGPGHYPYVRRIGGVSLFDFRGFDEAYYEKSYPLSSWHTFVPFRDNWGASIWIEIDHELLKSNFLSGTELLGRWKLDKAYRSTIMPLIEAASLIPVPRSAFRKIILASGSPATFEVY